MHNALERSHMAIHQSKQQQADRERIPPLESGDRLTRHEFERRYEAMPSGAYRVCATVVRTNDLIGRAVARSP